MEKLNLVAIQYGVAERTLPGQGQSGDRHIVKAHSKGEVIAVVDGLGHGEAAAAAAELAVGIVETYAGETVASLIIRCHHELRGTRGVALSIADLDAKAGTLTWAGIGNVEGLLVHASTTEERGKREHILLRGGVVGYHLPTFLMLATSVKAGDTLILATDGVKRDFWDEPRLDYEPQLLADTLLRRHIAHTDDALVLVARIVDP